MTRFQVGDHVRIARGERAHLDGKIVEVRAASDTSLEHYYIEAWLDRERVEVVVVDDLELVGVCPVERREMGRRIAAEKMRKLSEDAREARTMLLQLDELDPAARVWIASLTFSEIAGRLQR